VVRLAGEPAGCDYFSFALFLRVNGAGRVCASPGGSTAYTRILPARSSCIPASGGTEWHAAVHNAATPSAENIIAYPVCDLGNRRRRQDWRAIRDRVDYSSIVADPDVITLADIHADLRSTQQTKCKL
jgi:hypothetical protein